MHRRIILAIAILLSLAACKKEKFPEKENLIGTWTEQTEESFKHKLIFDDETMLFFKHFNTDTLLYRLDKKADLLFLTLKNSSSSGETSHKILFNKKSKTLTIFGLFPTIDNATETEFKKE